MKRIGKGVLDLIYPPGLYCISCGKITDDSRTYGLCNECMAAASWNTGRRCVKCGKPLSETDPGPMCFSCKETQASSRPHFFDKGYACAGYGTVEQSVIFAFKYGSRSDIGDKIGEMLYDRMLSEYEPDELTGMYDMVIPVPVYRDKKKKRGFNHADIMAESFAERAGLKFEPDLVVRTRATKPMKGLNPEERRANIEGAFDVRPHKIERLRGVSILLVDDIATTFSTIDEIARILKEPHANELDRCSPYRQDTGGSSRKTQAYRPRHAAPVIGASRVDFLAYAAAADYLIV